MGKCIKGLRLALNWNSDLNTIKFIHHIMQKKLITFCKVVDKIGICCSKIIISIPLYRNGYIVNVKHTLHTSWQTEWRIVGYKEHTLPVWNIHTVLLPFLGVTVTLLLADRAAQLSSQEEGHTVRLRSNLGEDNLNG